MPEANPRLVAALADRYQIQSELGAGGMATVYLARDLRHDRNVALKVLRPELAAVIGAERFLAEIKTTAALQHPHILPLFDSGQADGFLFYVMPLIEGESLRDRLTREHQLPVEDAVQLGKEIGGALDYAHRHGVIHRDIKPENILLHDGAALVADFGIALAASKAGGNRMTETGLSLGTPGYMSPEQATGERSLDARADVYSMGCLMYEMLAGQPPHTGPTIQAVIAAVVTKDPERLSVRRPSVPANIEAAIHKALAKLPADRFASADAFVRALSGPATAATLPALSSGGMAGGREGGRSEWWEGGRAIGIAIAVALIASLLAAWGWLRPRPHPFLNRYTLYLRENQTPSASTTGAYSAISPDGRRIVLTGRGEGSSQLWSKLADDVQVTPIPGTEGATSPFFSPDGRQLGFVRNGKTIHVMPFDGGSPLTLTDSANSTAADWGSDANIYFEVDSGIARIPATGGRIEPVYRFTQASRIIGTEWPVVLPGARGVLFRARRGGAVPGEFEIMVQPLPKGEAKVLVRGMYARYASSGHLIVVTFDGKLLAIPFDLGKLAITGPPMAMAEGLEADPYLAGVALSAEGTLIYRTAREASSRELVWVTRQGQMTRVDTTWKTDGTVNYMSLSPSGKAIAVEVRRAAKSDIWVKQIPGGPYARISFGDTSYTRPSWSADGSRVLFIADRGDGGGALMTRRADGVGPATRLLPAKIAYGQGLESPDGKWLIMRRVATDAGLGDIYAAKVGDSIATPLVAGPAREIAPALSPDMKWLAYASEESGALEVYVRPFPDVSSARWQVSTAGGSMPLWSHTGRELFFRDNKGDLVVVDVHGSPTFSVGRPRALFSLGAYAFGISTPIYSIAPDDQRFLMLHELSAGNAGQLIVNEHWVGELTGKR